MHLIGKSVPFELTTYEAMCKVKDRLNEDGVVITNVISAIEGDEATFIKHEYSTYKAVFDDVKLFAVNTQDKNQSQNLILIGIKGKPNVDVQNKEQYSSLLSTEIVDFESDYSIATDDYAPIGD